VEAAPADDVAVGLGDDHRVARPPCGHPLRALGRRAPLGLEGGDAVLDPLVVDAGDGRGVDLARRAHGDPAHRAARGRRAAPAPAIAPRPLPPPSPAPRRAAIAARLYTPPGRRAGRAPPAPRVSV